MLLLQFQNCVYNELMTNKFSKENCEGANHINRVDLCTAKASKTNKNCGVKIC